MSQSGLSPAQLEMKQRKDKAAFLMLELINEGYDLSEYIGQMLASYAESGAGVEEAIGAGAQGLNRLAELLHNPSHIWQNLLPGGGDLPQWQIVEAGAALDIGMMGENIKLPYGLDYHKDETVYHCPKGAEFFLDEHGRQWIKFFPSNGSDQNREHMFIVNHATDWIVRRT